MMNEPGWKEAIVQVLPHDGEPMHYADIAQAIIDEGIKNSVGATPVKSVAAIISLSRQNDGDDSPFIRVSRGFYALRLVPESEPSSYPGYAVPEEEEAGFINAFGMYWRREKILWSTTPRILGQQQAGSKSVDFCQQRGVYLLYDGNKVVYVGRTTDQALGVRLRQHTSDRLNGRWDRFSWFGIFAVTEDGALSRNPPEAFNLDDLIVTMEALLIEGLEPPQNRKRGDDFSAVEFLQIEDPELEKSQIIQLMDELKKKL